MLKQIFTSLALIAVFGLQSFCQQSIGDLKKSLRNQTNPGAQMHIKLEIGDLYQASNPDSALFWYNSIIPGQVSDSIFLAQWCKSAGDAEKYYLTVALARSGLIMVQKNNYDQGPQNLSLAIELALEINQPQLALYASDNLAVAYARNKKPDRAAEYFEKSLSLYKGLNDEKGIIFCLGNLGAINANLGNYYKAADFYEQLLNAQEQSNTPLETLDDLINIAALYLQLEEVEKAKPFWTRALYVAMEVKNMQKAAFTLSNLGAISYKQGEMEMAYQHYQSMLGLAKEISNQRDEVLALNNLATISYNLNDLSKSLKFWDEALNLALQIGRGQVVLDALINLSNINYQLENFEKSSQYFERYIALGKQIGDPGVMAQSYISIADIQERIENYSKAREYYQEAIKIYEQIGDATGLARVNVLIGKSFQSEQRYFTAMEFFRANIDSSKPLDSKSLADSYQGIADILRLQMQFPAALDNYQKALGLHQNLDDKNQASVCLNAMGLIHQVTGDFPKAVSYYERALNLAEDMGNKEGTAAIHNNLGVVYRQLGDLPKARDSYQKALEFYIEINNMEGASYGYNNLGIIYEQSGDYDKANEFYEKSLAIKQDSEDKLGLSASLMNMGNVYKHLKNFAKAEEFYNQSLGISKEINDKQGIALALGSIAALKLEVYDYNTAIDFANRSLEVAKEIDMQSVIKEAYRQLAWAHNASFVPEWAEDAYINVINMNHEDINRNFSILSESEKELFFRTIVEDFDRFHSFALRRKDTNTSITRDVYNNLLRNKGLLLKSSTAMRNAILGSNDAKLIELFEKWMQVKQEVARLYTLPIEERTADPGELEKQANELERALVRSSSEFSDFEKSLRIEWTTVKEGLKEGEAAIEFTQFIHGRDSVLYCAMIATSRCENPMMVPLFEEKELVNILGSFAGSNYQYINSIYGTNTQRNASLYDLIWKPMEPLLADIKTVYISPSGLLHKVSFAAIGSELNQYLIDRYELHVLSTTANVASDNKLIVNEDMTVGLFGGIAYSTVPQAGETWSYLKGTLDETIMIRNLLEEQFNQVVAVTDSLATEANFKQLAPQSHVLHVATHGFFFPDPDKIRLSLELVKEVGEIEFRGGSPTFGMSNFIQNQNPLMRSGLVFAGVNDYWGGAKAVKGDDGVLTALEVINIDLRKNQLVVLSACETGLGEIKGSEGVYGLQRAFKMAGAKYIVMSLWQVPDRETVEFMETFYTKLLKQKNLRKSFTETQQEMRSKYDPYYWAAFVLIE